MSDAINPQHYKRLPAEAIEIIEAAIDKSPSNQDAYLHGQALKYLLRCWHKNGIEDLRKAKWYLDRLIEHCDESLLEANKGLVKAWTCENGKAKQVYPEQPAIKQSLTTQPPDGWRFLEVGEVIRKGDRCFTRHSGSIDCLTSVGEKFNHEAHYPTIRRNKFEVGEKVVRVLDEFEFVIIDKHNRFNDVYVARNKMTGKIHKIQDRLLAPYIEETK